jgi:tetratricopeptide (TPR) repeat protein
MLYKYLSVICCCVFAGVIQANEINLDSLKKLLNGNLHDTSRCRIYYILAEKADEGEWQMFNQKMHDLALKKHTESEGNQILKKTYASFIGSSYANFAYLAQFDGAYDKAIDFLNNGYDYFVKAGNKAGISTVYISLGAIYQRKNNLDKASEYYLKALELAVAIKQIPNQIEVLNNLGNVSRQRGDVFNAIEYFENSLRLAE